jgi:glutamate-ammonia-ligase adenylyltransferase
LRLCSELDLIDTALASQVAGAYRHYRKLQHQIRLQGGERAHVDPSLVRDDADAVRKLWAAVLD